MDTKFINKSICFLGDSITEHGHYLYDIRSYFHNKPEKVFVHNCGTGGNRAIMAQYILDKEIEVYNPDFVVISFGVNDMGVQNYRDNPTDDNLSAREQSRQRHLDGTVRLVKALIEKKHSRHTLLIRRT